MAPIPNLRRQCLRAALTVAYLSLYALPAYSQGLEFQGLELRARLDNPTGDNLWRLGDANGNGEIDNDESGGQYVDFERTLNESPQPLRTQTVTYPVYVAIGPLLGPTSWRGTFNGVDLRDDLDPSSPEYQIQHGTVNGDSVDLFIGYTEWRTDTYTLQPAVEYASYARSSGMQLMYGITFAANHSQPDSKNDAASNSDQLEIGAGARFFNLVDRSVLDYSFYVDSTLDMQSVGPQLSIDWMRQRGRFGARAGAAASMAYAQTDGIQWIEHGDDVIPGGLNQLPVLRPVTYQNSVRHEDFLPMAEAGIQASYRIWPSVVCFARYDAIYFGDLPQARDSVVWRLPDMGLHLDDGSDVLTTLGTLGLEWRR
jgi:hypothetical protein